MKGDFARVTYDPALHYSRVLQQQGRVLLEADWNEQGAIHLHLLRALAVDLVGPCWAAGAGFRIATSDPKDPNKPAPLADWRLSAGHFYVDGILCVNEDICALAGQPCAPTPDYGVGDGRTGFENPQAPYALWLDVWERHLSWIEAPHIVDPALNGVDTTSRAQVVWQLRILTGEPLKQWLQTIIEALKRHRATLDDGSDAANAADARIEDLQKNGAKRIDDIFAALGGSTGTANAAELNCERLRALLELRASDACPRLAAQLQPPESDEDPCVIAAEARYRGCENQLYRVEIHEGGLAATESEAGASFKWSRENGSVVFPILDFSEPGEPAADGSAPMTVTLASLGRDARLGVAVGDWVELVDDDYTLGQRAFALLRVTAVDTPGRRVTLSVPKNVTRYRLDGHKHPLLRRWDEREGTNAQGVLDVKEGTWIGLEDGIQIRFGPGGVYANGDYWLIPARVAENGKLDWPQAAGGDGKPVPVAVRASGLHHYAVLGGVDAEGDYRECCCRLISLCTQRLLSAGHVLEPSPIAPARPVAAGAAPAQPGAPVRRPPAAPRTRRRNPT